MTHYRILTCIDFSRWLRFNERMQFEYYKAATEAAAVAEKDWFGVVKLTGADRAS